jgi:hypothetical protein
MAQAFIDTDTDTVYVQRGKSDFIVISQDGDPVTVFNLPGNVVPLISEDEVDYDGSYDEGYDSGYSDGQDAGYSDADLEDEYNRGYEDGREEGRREAEEDAASEDEEC